MVAAAPQSFYGRQALLVTRFVTRTVTHWRRGFLVRTPDVDWFQDTCIGGNCCKSNNDKHCNRFQVNNQQVTTRPDSKATFLCQLRVKLGGRWIIDRDLEARILEL